MTITKFIRSTYPVIFAFLDPAVRPVGGQGSIGPPLSLMGPTGQYGIFGPKERSSPFETCKNDFFGQIYICKGVKLMSGPLFRNIGISATTHHCFSYVSKNGGRMAKFSGINAIFTHVTLETF